MTRPTETGFTVIELMIVIFIVLIIAAVAYPHLEHRNDTCTESHKETITTYPNAGLSTLGPEYSGLAYMPVMQEVDVCTKWEPKQ